jgi:hypothetical protein
MRSSPALNAENRAEVVKRLAAGRSFQAEFNRNKKGKTKTPCSLTNPYNYIIQDGWIFNANLGSGLDANQHGTF